MAEPADKLHAPQPRQDENTRRSEERHVALERRGDLSAYDSLLGGSAAGPRPVQPAPNRTGLPDRLKAGIEALSGLSMDGVKVHYGSSKPAQLGAHAFTQGSEIHVAPAQERHLPHEAWHVVQQAQGRVKPTMQLRGESINAAAGLEREADVMGGRAAMTRPLDEAPSIVGHAQHREILQLRTAGEFTPEETAAVDALPQVNHDPLRLAALRNGTRSGDDLETLSAMKIGGVVPTHAEMVALEGVEIAKIETLLALPQLPQVVNWPGLLEVAQLGRPGPAIRAIAGMEVGGQTPTVAEMAGLGTIGVAKIEALVAAKLPQVTNWDELRQLAKLDRHPQTIIKRAKAKATGQIPTLEQIVASEPLANSEIVAARTANPDLGWHQLLLVATGRPPADIQTLSELQVGGRVPTLAEMVALGAIDIARINALVAANLPQVTNWDELRQLAKPGRRAQTIIARAADSLAGPPTLAQLVASGRFAAADLDPLRAANLAQNWDQLLELADTGFPAADIQALSALQIGGYPPTIAEVAALKGLGIYRVSELVKANLPQVTNWDELRQLAELGGTPFSTTLRASTTVANQRPTLEQIVASKPFSQSQILIARAANPGLGWDELLLVATGRTAPEIAAVRAVPVAGATPTMPELRASLGTVHEAMLTQIQRLRPTLERDLAPLAEYLGVNAELNFDTYVAALIDMDIAGDESLGYNDDLLQYSRYLTDAINYNACYDAAERLAGSYSTGELTYESGGAPHALYGLEEQRLRGQQLAQHLQAAGQGEATLFRIHLGGHGFVLVLEKSRAFLLQSLANSADSGTLRASIESGLAYPIADAARHMEMITGSDPNQRGLSAGALGWNAVPIAVLEDEATPKALMRVYWTAAPLVPRAVLIATLARKIEANRAMLLARLGH